MTPQKSQRLCNLYTALMEETKIRLDCLSRLINDFGPKTMPPSLGRETGFLQLRMSCELIALACLTAHGDIEAAQSTKLQKAYRADYIINALERLHADFYPRPVRMDDDPATKGKHIEPKECDYLTKSDLIALYAKCGERLHRGSIRKILSPLDKDPYNWKDLIKWHNKFIRLLEQHHITLLGGQNHLLCALRVDAVGGNVQVAFAEPQK